MGSYGEPAPLARARPLDCLSLRARPEERTARVWQPADFLNEGGLGEADGRRCLAHPRRQVLLLLHLAELGRPPVDASLFA